MTHDKLKDVSFMGVGVLLIVFGALIFVFGLMGWYLSGISGVTVMAFPFFKVIGGLIVLALGYLILEMELLRRK